MVDLGSGVMVCFMVCREIRWCRVACGRDVVGCMLVGLSVDLFDFHSVGNVFLRIRVIIVVFGHRCFWIGSFEMLL